MHTDTKFNYLPLSRTTGPNGRQYIVDSGRPLPSVTTILSATANKEHLQQWVERVGIVEADRIKNEASTLGSAMHDNLENYILGKPITGQYMPKVLASVIIKHGLSKVDTVWGTEVGVFCKDLYAGTADLFGLHQGVPAVMDFKNSLNDKRAEWIEDYFLQLCAYKLCHDETYGTNLQRGVIMIATRAAKYQEFVVEGADLDMYMHKWMVRLSSYYELYGN